MKPRIFIGSSVEGLSVAYAMQQNLTHDAESTVWDQGVFELSQTGIESLVKTLNSVDYAAFVFSPDDELTMRGKKEKSVRDNVIFELGLFIGMLSRERVFFIVPDGKEFHLPTDLLGVTPGKYDSAREDGSLQAATGAVCNQIRTVIKRLGRIDGLSGDQAPEEAQRTETEESRDWFDHLIQDEFDEAREKLAADAIGKEGEEKAKLDLWAAFIDMKESRERGVESLFSAVAENSEYSAVYCLASSMLSWEGYHAKSVELIEEAREKFPDSPDVLIEKASRLKAVGEGEKAIAVLLAGNDEPSAGVAMALADAYKEAAEPDSAVEILRTTFIRYPNDSELKIKLAGLCLDTKKSKEALALFRELTAEYPENSQYWGYFGNAALNLGLHSTSMAAYRKANELADGKAGWLVGNIGNLMNNRGFFEEAIDYFKKSIEIDPDSQYAHERLASTLGNKDKESKRLSELCAKGRLLIYDPSVEA